MRKNKGITLIALIITIVILLILLAVSIDLVSDGAEKFKAFANTILPCDVMEADVVNIEQY